MVFIPKFHYSEVFFIDKGHYSKSHHSEVSYLFLIFPEGSLFQGLYFERFFFPVPDSRYSERSLFRKVIILKFGILKHGLLE